MIFRACRFYRNKFELSIQNMLVVVGAHIIADPNEASQRHYRIQQAVLHEKYLTQKPRNDIMLLRLSSNITFNDNVQPICVDASVFPTNTRCIVTGWGTTVAEGKCEIILRTKCDF